jgi:hypothetical protein
MSLVDPDLAVLSEAQSAVHWIAQIRGSQNANPVAHLSRLK